MLGVVRDPIREKLLYETGLSLSSACSIVHACESSAIQLSQILSRPEAVHAVKDKSGQERHQHRQKKTRGQQHHVFGACSNCGRKHAKGV